jgi:hypothetical protein
LGEVSFESILLFSVSGDGGKMLLALTKSSDPKKITLPETSVLSIKGVP